MTKKVQCSDQINQEHASTNNWPICQKFC